MIYSFALKIIFAVGSFVVRRFCCARVSEGNCFRVPRQTFTSTCSPGLEKNTHHLRDISYDAIIIDITKRHIQ